MREIEFRAKKTENGKWVYGYYHKLNESFENKDCILEHHRNTSTIIDITTLGQYTALKDKNGTKIFEGDILKSRHSRYYYKVYFEDYRYFVEDCWGTQITPKQEAINHFECEVVGNIHDNPELVEVDNEN